MPPPRFVASAARYPQPFQASPGGHPLALFVGDWRQAVLIGGLATLSSTVIALKLLADRGEVDTPHGRAAVGILLW